MTRGIWINIPVRDLDRSKLFFSKLGFEYNAKFTDDKAACMVINEHAGVMLLREPFFKGFTKREQCNTATHTEALFAFSVDSRQAVEALFERAIANGASEAMPPQDHGFMYARSFYDLDGHHWEVLWMDPAAAQ